MKVWGNQFLKFIKLKNVRVLIIFGNKIFIREIFMNFVNKKKLIFGLFQTEVEAND